MAKEASVCPPTLGGSNSPPRPEERSAFSAPQEEEARGCGPRLEADLGAPGLTSPGQAGDCSSGFMLPALRLLLRGGSQNLPCGIVSIQSSTLH